MAGAVRDFSGPTNVSRRFRVRYAVKLGSGVVQVPNLYTVDLSTAILCSVCCYLLGLH